MLKPIALHPSLYLRMCEGIVVEAGLCRDYHHAKGAMMHPYRAPGFLIMLCGGQDIPTFLDDLKHRGIPVTIHITPEDFQQFAQLREEMGIDDDDYE